MKIEEAIEQTKPFANPQVKAVVNLYYTSSWWLTQQSQKLKPYGISIQQFNILRILRGSYPQSATVKILSKKMLDKNSNASRLVDKLEKKKLVERIPNEADRRQVDIFITEEGLKLLASLDEKMNSEQDINLTEEEADTLSNLLDKLRG